MDMVERWEYGVILAMSLVVGGVVCGGFAYAVLQLVRSL